MESWVDIAENIVDVNVHGGVFGGLINVVAFFGGGGGRGLRWRYWRYWICTVFSLAAVVNSSRRIASAAE